MGEYRYRRLPLRPIRYLVNNGGGPEEVGGYIMSVKKPCIPLQFFVCQIDPDTKKVSGTTVDNYPINQILAVDIMDGDVYDMKYQGIATPLYNNSSVTKMLTVTDNLLRMKEEELEVSDYLIDYQQDHQDGNIVFMMVLEAINEF